MNRITRTLVPLVAILLNLTFACNEKVNWNFPEFEPIPVVNSILRAGQPISVQVSLAQGIDTMPLHTVDNAEVRLFVDGELYGMLTHRGDGIYTSSLVTKTLVEYYCEVDIPKIGTVSSTCTLPKATKITRVEHIDRAGITYLNGIPYPAIRITFPNNPKIKQYFEIELMLDEGDYQSSASLMEITDPILLNEGLPILVFSNETIEEDSYTMTINYTTWSFERSDTSGFHTELFPILIELRSISYDYYKYLKQLHLYKVGSESEIFSGVGSNFNLYSNMEGGHGIFAGYSSVVSDTIYPKGYTGSTGNTKESYSTDKQ